MSTTEPEMSPKVEVPRSVGTPCVSCPLLGHLERLFPPKKPFYRRRPIIFTLLMIALLCILWNVVKFIFFDEGADSFADGAKIAVVRVEGAILDNKQTLKWISKIRRDKNVKGVLLRIDSPGGGAAASQELFEYLRSLNEVKPVVASMGSMAASGGLMVAMSARHIVANPSTLTGSIGVKMTLPQIYNLMDKVGVSQESLATGKYKDAGSPFKPLKEDDKKYFTELIDDMYAQFVELVARSRNIPEDKIRLLADGKAFTGREAKVYGLVDELGSQDVALRHLSKLCGVSAETPLMERPRQRDVLRMFAESLMELEISTRYRPPDFMFIF